MSDDGQDIHKLRDHRHARLRDMGTVYLARDVRLGRTVARLMVSTSALPDIVREGLNLIFVGINPGRHSARAGHHYAGPGNHFWPLLHESGLIPEPLSACDDHRLPKFGIGLLNIVGRTTPGSADLSAAELRIGARSLAEKLGRLRPRIVCFNGRIVYQALLRLPAGESGITPPPAPGRLEDGIQKATLAGNRVFVMPSTSPRAAFPRAYRLELFGKLRTAMEAV